MRLTELSEVDLLKLEKNALGAPQSTVIIQFLLGIMIALTLVL